MDSVCEWGSKQMPSSEGEGRQCKRWSEWTEQKRGVVSEEGEEKKWESVQERVLSGFEGGRK